MMNPYRKDILEAAAAHLPWGTLKDCNILITGATGLIGSCLTDLLLTVSDLHDIPFQVFAMGRNRVKGLKRFHADSERPGFHFIEHDVIDPLQEDIPFHFIVHAASSASPQLYRKVPVEVMKSNIFGVTNLLDYGRAHGMKRFLFVSSGEVYGDQPVNALNESAYGYVDNLEVRSCYPSSKRAAETMTVCYSKEYGVDTVIARPCHTFGPYFTDSDQRAYAQFIRNIQAGEDIVLRSDGGQYRSWCYVVDCAKALCYVLLKGVTGQAYNVADSHCESSLRRLAEILAEIGGRNLSVGQPDATSSQRVVFDTTRLQQLGWTAEGTLRTKLEHTLQSRILLTQ